MQGGLAFWEIYAAYLSALTTGKGVWETPTLRSHSKQICDTAHDLPIVSARCSYLWLNFVVVPAIVSRYSFKTTLLPDAITCQNLESKQTRCLARSKGVFSNFEENRLHLMCGSLLELSVRWYTVVYTLGVYMECLPRMSWKIKSSTSKTLQHSSLEKTRHVNRNIRPFSNARQRSKTRKILGSAMIDAVPHVIAVKPQKPENVPCWEGLFPLTSGGCNRATCTRSRPDTEADSDPPAKTPKKHCKQHLRTLHLIFSQLFTSYIINHL
jgi:hypothetical protein